MKRKAVESILIDFRDGIDTSQPATQIERTALVQLQNCLFTSPGRIESRLGYSKYNSTAISGLSSVRWACRFYDNDGTTKRKYCAGPHTTYEKVYYSSTDDDGTWTEVTGGSNLTKGRMSHVFWKNKIFLSNGTEAIQIIDGTTKSDLSAAPVNPTGKYICLHMERLWVADGTTLYWSDVADETTFETNSFMEVGEDTESIVGVVSFGSKLLIFKPSGVWELWGDPGEWQLEQIPGLPGSISPHTIGTMLGGGGVVWLAREGLAYYDDGSGFQWLKNKNIRAFLDSIDADDFSEIVGIYHDGYFSFHYRYDGSSYNDRGLIYDFHVGGWSSLKGVPVACMVWENGSGDDNEVFFGDSNGGYLYKMFDGYNDEGTRYR